MAGATATALVGPWLVLVLLACGVVELFLRRRTGGLASGDSPRERASRGETRVGAWLPERAFLDGAGPAAIGAILGSAIPLALALSEGFYGGVAGMSCLCLDLIVRFLG